MTGKAPWIEIETSIFADDWMRMLEDPKHSDVTFLLEGQHQIEAHKIVLCSASKFFCRVFRKTFGKVSEYKCPLQSVQNDNISFGNY